jgi:hypothetical protein
MQNINVKIYLFKWFYTIMYNNVSVKQIYIHTILQNYI